MILAFDSHYFDNKAKTVCLEFEDWSTTSNYKVHTETLENIAQYVSGEFYKRELPCILSLLSKFDLNSIHAIVIDGFVYLDDDGKFGLGAHLFEKLNKKIPIIGVAKTNFATINQLKKSLFRGESKKPLFITAIGMNLDEAFNNISAMQGDFRIPTLLKALDTFTKQTD